jgi:hypothetical protein
MKLLFLFLCFLFLTACSVEESEIPTLQEVKFEINAASSAGKLLSPTAIPCQTSDLIAGQNIVVGTVDVYIDAFSLSIVYSTIPGWNLDETHMSIGNCTGDIPATGSGNPKVGHFEYSALHTSGTSVVNYTTDSTSLAFETCIAAHAVVTSSTGQNETSWGAGVGFPGRAWATYIELDMLSCNTATKDPSDPDNDR